MRRARTVRRESCWILARLLPWVGRPKYLSQRDCNITIDGSSTIAPICAACRHSAFFREQGTSWRSEHSRLEEHTVELQSLMRTSYAVFSLKKKTQDVNKKQNKKLP